MLKVLLIDDDPIEKRIIENLLKNNYRLPYALEYAQDMVEAVELLNKWTYDIILLDDRLGSLTSETTLPQIRSISGSVAIIVISNFASSRHLQNKEELGADEIVDKYYLKDRIETGLFARG